MGLVSLIHKKQLIKQNEESFSPVRVAKRNGKTHTLPSNYQCVTGRKKKVTRLKKKKVK